MFKINIFHYAINYSYSCNNNYGNTRYNYYLCNYVLILLPVTATSRNIDINWYCVLKHLTISDQFALINVSVLVSQKMFSKTVFYPHNYSTYNNSLYFRMAEKEMHRSNLRFADDNNSWKIFKLIGNSQPRVWRSRTHY